MIEYVQAQLSRTCGVTSVSLCSLRRCRQEASKRASLRAQAEQEAIQCPPSGPVGHLLWFRDGSFLAYRNHQEVEMRQSSGTAEGPAEKVVKDVRRRTKKHHSAEERIRIALDGLRARLLSDVARYLRQLPDRSLAFRLTAHLWGAVAPGDQGLPMVFPQRFVPPLILCAAGGRLLHHPRGLVTTLGDGRRRFGLEESGDHFVCGLSVTGVKHRSRKGNQPIPGL